MLGTVNLQLETIYESPKGSKFKIEALGSLYQIRMLNGGVTPSVCNQKFTTFKKAKYELERYFRNNPKPVPREKSKVVTPKEE